MASSIAGCVLGVARLISSASAIWVKIGPGWNLNTRSPCGVWATRLVPRMSAGMRSGVNWMRLNLSWRNPPGARRGGGRHEGRRELDAVELELQHAAERAHEQRLAQPGDAFQEAVAAGEERCQHPADDVVVAHDHLAQLRFDRLEVLLESRDLLLGRCRIAHSLTSCVLGSLGFR